jgi:hypothetical protein
MYSWYRVIKIRVNQIKKLETEKELNIFKMYSTHEITPTVLQVLEMSTELSNPLHSSNLMYILCRNIQCTTFMLYFRSTSRYRLFLYTSD